MIITPHTPVSAVKRYGYLWLAMQASSALLSALGVWMAIMEWGIFQHDVADTTIYGMDRMETIITDMFMFWLAAMVIYQTCKAFLIAADVRAKLAEIIREKEELERIRRRL